MKVASKRFTDLRTWQESHRLSLEIYRITDGFPKSEMFSLANQLRRAATSVSSDIAEGFNRFSKKEKIQFYSISLGSVSEVHSQLILAKDLGYIPTEDYRRLEERIEIIHKSLAAPIKSIR